MFKKTLKNWIGLSRLPFHTVGILPYILGSVIAVKLYGEFKSQIFFTGLIAIIFIMLATYYNGEVYDINEDTIADRIAPNRFAGGSKVLIKNFINKKYIKLAASISILLAIIMGLLLIFYYRTGPLTVVFGFIGAVCGFFYSKPPLRFAKRGIGEIIIGFCYGWLPVATGFYLQIGSLNNIINFISIPIALSIFNVILINEFSDYIGDKLFGKKNLAVRVGLDNAAIIYSLITVLEWLFFILSVYYYMKMAIFLMYIPIIILSIYICIKVLGKEFYKIKKLELLCGLTLLINLATTAIYIIAFINGWYNL